LAAAQGRIKHRGTENTEGEEAREKGSFSVPSVPLCFNLFLFSEREIAVEMNELSHAIIGAAIEVHRRLGPGLLESAYRICLAYELQKRGFEVEGERPVPVVYDEVKLDCGFRADLVVNSRIVVELKAKSALHPVDEAQTLSHLRLLKLRLGLLINFHEVKLVDGVRRIINGHEES
jgi:GxxExxY protein